MKVLLYDTNNAFLTLGGKIAHALKLQQELSKLGVHIEFSRWWDESQADCDIIHFLAPDVRTARNAKLRDKKTLITLIFDNETSKTVLQQRISILKYKMISRIPIKERLYWRSFPYFDRFVFMHQYDRDAALRYFSEIDEKKTRIIPHAYDPNDIFISDHLNIADLNFPEKYLVSCANIIPRKQSVLLAQYAKRAQVPVVFIGYGNPNDAYFHSFIREIDNRYVFYTGYISKEWKDCIERNASGFILLSQGESGCIAVYEAAAYKMPLMLSNLPWAWGYEDPKKIYFCDFRNSNKAVEQIKDFFDQSGMLENYPFTINGWHDVAKMYRNVYEELMNQGSI